MPQPPNLPTELRALFGEQIMEQAKRLHPEEVDAPAVHEAAGALLLLKGQPAQQIDLVRAMNPATAAALARWVADPAFWALVAGITKH